jgi:hypothetical protein
MFPKDISLIKKDQWLFKKKWQLAENIKRHTAKTER